MVAGSGEASAEDVVFEPVANAPIVDNFIQVHNPSGEAGSYTIQFADNESDLVLDRVEGDLEAGASAFVYLDAVDVDDARLLTVTVYPAGARGDQATCKPGCKSPGGPGGHRASQVWSARGASEQEGRSENERTRRRNKPPHEAD